MNTIRVTAILLLVLGILGLAYGGFTYTRERSEASLGPIELTLSEEETINIPVWAGVGAIVLGGGLLLVGRRRL
ncbi:LPXTG cell wall anchor domain-containing protein [Saccharospirillum impatiens]|uniref:LPXTG cell wall anchor domain-containing protein n=1 Tax=Saccharospirillum impatiens TaxID=169438 RepID=UPI00040A1EF5|nr:LPXTG cell wall anchor domain-containing protein [Saccharospirillum impatiens]